MISRRRLITSGALLAGGLVVGFSIPGVMRLRSGPRLAPPLGDPGWIHIAPDETVTLYSTRVEMGQGAWTALAQIVNEDLEADFARVRIQMASPGATFTKPVGFATQNSSSVQRIFAGMRSIGAAARQMLIETAAQDWNVPPAECRVANGVVLHESSGRKATYGSLAARAAGREVPGDPPLKKRDQWQLIGKSVPRIESAGTVDGSARYTMDLQFPEMLSAAVSQSLFSGSRIASIDRAAALASPGVLRIVELGEAVAVVARNYWSASRGLTRARVAWSASPSADTATLRAQLRASAESNLPSSQSTGAPGRIVRALYEAPLLGHAQMEPQSAVARMSGSSAEVWAPTQILPRMQEDVAKALALPASAVTVHAPPLGGGFGRRTNSDHGVTAALIAKEVGAPVKAVWSRADDFQQDRFRPMSAAHLQATLDEKGRLADFRAHVASLGDSDRRGALADFPYTAAKKDVQGTAVPSPIRLGLWRSVDSSQTVFFRECFIDECAAAAGVNPLAYRRALLTGKPRALRVLDAAAQLSRWDDAGRYLGLAFHEEFGSPCAHVVEVERTSGGALRVKRVFVAVDCGTAINPAGVRAQIEGGVLMGLSAALYEEITCENGALRQLNFDTYPVLRMNGAPPIDVRILESPEEEIGGIGEVGVPPLAPALVNAVFSATQRRVRSLPLAHAGIDWA